MRFDRSWLPTIGAVLVLFFAQRAALSLPLIGRQAIATAGGVWLLWLAWQAWNQRTLDDILGNSRNVQYWRGQRIELQPQRTRTARSSLPPSRIMAIAALYGLAGLGALVIVLNGAL